jgi:two-component system, NarL family, sensor histidine kinase DesK
MNPSTESLLLRLRGRLIPHSHGHGWMPFYMLGYLVFLFMPMILSWVGDTSGWRGSPTRMGPTLLSIAVFLPVYLAAYRVTGIRSLLCMLAIAGIGYALLPFNPFANNYTIYAVGFAAMLDAKLWVRLAWVAALLAVLLIEIIVLRYPIFIFLITLIIAVAVFFGNHHFVVSTHKRAELKLSHDEISRLAALAERERIGRDLHDLLGHTLSLVALKSELAGKLLRRDGTAATREAAHREIVEVARVARDALTQVRSAVTGIRSTGIAAELASAKSLLDSDGIALVSVVQSGCLDGGVLPATIETALALTLREAITNLQRHARAGEARLDLRIEAGEAILRVADNGCGAAIEPGNGLTGMRERIEALGGQLRVASRKGEGVSIEARVPLSAHQHEATHERQT